nr:retrovirus-related Pol polyprotein from transposon TNT 1-94 [Tanacetum cinerariifolium]
TSISCSLQQNGVVERRNRILIEVARTMLIYAKTLLFLSTEAVATACYTQNRSIIRLRHRKTPYEILHNKLPELSFFYVFGTLCYPTNDSEKLVKLQPKADIGIFIGYAPKKKAFRIYNRRTRRIIKTILVDFDELTAMASEHSSLEPALHEMTPATISSRLMPNLPPSTLFVPPSRTDWDLFEKLVKLQPKADIGIFIGYAPKKKAFRIYNRRTRRIIKTILVDFDELTAMASEHSSLEPALHEMTPATISSRLMPNLPPSTLVNHPALEVIAPIAEVVAPEPIVSTGSPSSTTVDQDAPSPSNSQTQPEIQSPVIYNNVKVENHDLAIAHMNNDPFFGFEESPKHQLFVMIHFMNLFMKTQLLKDHH